MVSSKARDALSTAAVSQVFGKHNEAGTIYTRTVGIVFLGTPHQGVGKRSLGDIVASVGQIETGKVSGSKGDSGDVDEGSKKLAELMRTGAETLDAQRDEFLLVSRDLHVVCVREVLPTQGVAVSV